MSLCACNCGQELPESKRQGSKFYDKSHRAKYHRDIYQAGQEKMQSVLSQAVSATVQPVPSLFDGKTYSHDSDCARLTNQSLRVFDCMADGHWRTLDEISRCTGDMHQSISARIRDFRKEKFGGHTVDRRHRGDRERGLFEYRLIVKAEAWA